MAVETAFARTITVDGEVVGNVLSWEHQGRRLVGYWISRDHWGKGIATGALSEALKELPRPLFAYVAEHNVASIRVLQKCGFQSSADFPPRMDDDVVELTMVLR